MNTIKTLKSLYARELRRSRRRQQSRQVQALLDTWLFRVMVLEVLALLLMIGRIP